MDQISLDIILRNHRAWLDSRGRDGDRANLSQQALGFADLKGKDLTSSVLQKANLQRSNLSESKFDDADLRDADLSYADLGNASLRGANLIGAVLTGCNLAGANLEGAKLERASFAFCNFTAANLSGALGNKISFYKCKFHATEIIDCHFEKSDFSFANFIDLKILDSTFGGSNFDDSTFTWTRFDNCILIEASFKNVDTAMVRFVDCDTTGTKIDAPPEGGQANSLTNQSYFTEAQAPRFARQAYGIQIATRREISQIQSQCEEIERSVSRDAIVEGEQGSRFAQEELLSHLRMRQRTLLAQLKRDQLIASDAQVQLLARTQAVSQLFRRSIKRATKRLSIQMSIVAVAGFVYILSTAAVYVIFARLISIEETVSTSSITAVLTMGALTFLSGATALAFIYFRLNDLDSVMHHRSELENAELLLNTSALISNEYELNDQELRSTYDLFRGRLIAATKANT